MRQNKKPRIEPSQISEQGTDKYGENISSGIKCFLLMLGAGGFVALILWQLPNLANFILAIKG
ncbi:hypothetical protein BKK47_09915 [Rodentibacter mrazii]|uniref:Uncharacterized protein n=1 Tax=Rodentibacter mrazii TaxID=1908257 RepID=A0A1V3ICQ3_9PAST|nr:hypothetical protein [Rodentibacter mrazii]OOF38190.1 hypothetical protein BKK47_09915 [Rodentibacter mrazii]